MVSHRRPTQSGLNRSVRATVLSAAAATAAATLTGAPANADPQDARESAVAAVDRLLGEAERATERYNEAGERAESLRQDAERAQDRAAREQEGVNRMRDELGAIAGAQYRTGSIDPALALLLSSDPDTYLERAAALDRVGARQSLTLDKLRRAQRALAQTRAEAGHALAELERDRAAVTRHKRTVESRLRQARRLLASLPPQERASFDRASRTGRDGEPDLSGVAPGSPRAMSAVAAARQALGRPYVWGANGPSGFDCSGLMQWAYAQAGVALPRTSQAQRYAGRMVPLSQARPGDLVAYRADASHIGMYVGDGQVIHAPYPGAPVRYDPVGMMPVSSVTRI
ncbi:putative endopeptidase precursor [Streptomyces sp. ADI96-02]|uniref:C40 family peptidase n=1 Tax=Streptomyces sp. ADI96-02 TaxID=1522760 RepID=UPI000F54F3F3|nr:C40 family peptidase [Streptomyces sp. ADI96-02]RPK66057.1 putative endopeptidase precursor [Streptomyces sp. ADI96-02]